MYTGFNLDLGTTTSFSPYHQSIGENVFKVNKEEVGQKIDEFISVDGVIDGKRMQDNWFPKIEADIFLSHSHADRDKALGLAGWLKEELGLKVFIDSAVWGYSDDLLKQIDNEYCYNTDTGSYIYEKRNYSTSHVHAMLTTALVNMIHNTECLLFLNTPQAIRSREVVVEQTISPWIYMELAMSKLVEKTEPKRDFVKKAFELSEEYKNLTIAYDVDIDHLQKITYQHLVNWQDEYSKLHPKTFQLHALDVLYMQCKLLKTVN